MLSDSSIRYQVSITEGDRGGGGGVGVLITVFKYWGRSGLQGSEEPGEGFEPTATQKCCLIPLNFIVLTSNVQLRHHVTHRRPVNAQLPSARRLATLTQTRRAFGGTHPQIPVWLWTIPITPE